MLDTGVCDRCRDLSAHVAHEATLALVDLPQHEIRVWPYYDVLMAAMRDWDRVSMLDLTEHAVEPFAWFLFRHSTEDWWCAYQGFTGSLNHPFDGQRIHHDLVRPAYLTAEATVDEFVDELFALTVAGRVHKAEREPAGGVSGMGSRFAPAGRDRSGARETLDDVFARWALGHFPDHEKARAYLMLTALVS